MSVIQVISKPGASIQNSLQGYTDMINTYNENDNVIMLTSLTPLELFPNEKVLEWFEKNVIEPSNIKNPNLILVFVVVEITNYDNNCFNLPC